MTKTYVLVESLDSSAPIYQTTGTGTRSQIKKMPWHRPFMDLPVEDKEGVSFRLRYKATSKEIFADKQLEVNKIDANAKFTDQERTECYFRHGILTTTKENLQRFLETHPEFEGSTYTSSHVRQKCYKLLDLAGEQKIKNQDFRKRLKASNRIAELDLEGAQQMIIRINGFAVQTPDNLEECQNWLIQFLDDAEDEGIEAIMKEDKAITIDEKTTILIGELVNNKLLEFAIDSHKITKPGKDSKKIEVREIVADSMPEKERLFGNFLDSADGKALRSDLENDLAEFKKKSKQDSKPKT